MAIYAVGDIQGCYAELQLLLAQMRFDPAQDRLWLVGDLVNRGPGSLEVLRLVKSLGDSAITVLGNHDLHLLAVAEGAAELHRTDTLDGILSAPDRGELLAWLRQQRLLYAEGDYVLVHAGLLPQWGVKQAASLAREVESALRSDDYATFLARMYGNAPHTWDDGLAGYKRLRVIVNAFTRMRICTPQGEMEFKFKGEVEHIPAGFLPWFDVPERKSRKATVIFGHWSALGLKVTPNVIALDTGCLWGGPMTAIRLDDRQLFQVSCNSPVAKHW
ncbi:symmetrical bis(5'-nucleosyl)-tetraphosphatase [Sideroxydans lithotrophicus]|uniref:Bis(5'-nucleosyl)-tetraphosphatase, symmetrical n=1 Tax=Sideroxydans lithotrophicus (strain ES-1) TaxID=580332 RepID=D5CQ75_SIDLE|nr:symmetrical bis(5'-nucleosyl)-tetraphosphatase [Sideroxydans lithotrophicus]ADE13096.1 bis(5'-nucleosyl)-tetraphosphatase (symmetrical) [Sideroxydans lithotrophicus ES-1]